ncbi:MAG: Nramp family divalent metal transporter [Verrucomicrobia bacterium]|nr:Nramp family divalent metal transporter [Verrucomicrobiota bacterium]
MTEITEAPRTWRGILKQLGPGLIISANIVGSGELIVTTKLGADVGFILLWFIILGCVIKVFVQLELGRYAISKGKTTLQAMNTVPGPKFVVSWLVWLWSLMWAAIFFQLSGMVGGIAQVLGLAGSNLSHTILAILITGSCAALLWVGRYKFIQNFSTFTVAAFSIFTVFAVFSLYWTDYGITGAQLGAGLSFQLTDDFLIAFAAFGVIGVGASELIYYPYWCLEKGYGRYVGPDDGSEAWINRAKGWIRVMKYDALLSLVIYTGATIAFYLLGAAVLHGKSLEVTNENLMVSLSNIYSTSFGSVGLWVFIVGAIVVLYSTIFISTASNGRLAADFLNLLSIVKQDTEAKRAKTIRIACVVLPALYCIFYLSIRKPVTLVTIGAVAQALMLPFLSFAALYFLYKQTHVKLRPKVSWIVFLWISAMLMTSVGIFQITKEFQKFFL